jgi:hypothetical protein
MIDSTIRAIRSVAATLVATVVAAVVLAYVSLFWAAIGALTNASVAAARWGRPASVTGEPPWTHGRPGIASSDPLTIG